MTYTKRITFNKEFLTGTLAGVRVPCEILTTDDACFGRLKSLDACTTLTPGRDAVTGAEFFVYNLGCENVRQEVAR